MTGPETPQTNFVEPPEDKAPGVKRIRERIARILEVRERIAARIAAHPDDPAVEGMKVRLAEFDAEEAYFERLLGADVASQFRTAAVAERSGRLQAEAAANAAEAEPPKEG